MVGSKLYIFGGLEWGYLHDETMAIFDLHSLKTPGGKWVFSIPDVEPRSGRTPSLRSNHTMIDYEDKMYLFGGTDGLKCFNDIWSYEPSSNKWTQLSSVTQLPLPREGHTAALVDDMMYIFGGRMEDGTDLGDLMAFRIPTGQWYKFHDMGPSPSPRSGHSMTVQGKQIIVTGGDSSQAPGGDPAELSMVYILDTTRIRYPHTPSMNHTGTYQHPDWPLQAIEPAEYTLPTQAVFELDTTRVFELDPIPVFMLDSMRYPLAPSRSKSPTDCTATDQHPGMPTVPNCPGMPETNGTLQAMESNENTVPACAISELDTVMPVFEMESAMIQYPNAPSKPTPPTGTYQHRGVPETNRPLQAIESGGNTVPAWAAFELL
ncbi:MAG: Negative regulator of mitotic exit [Peltula sp. TS41687]|nr:MAG: Negative regulator of mitotic exit [Peltula sp. TS41687]